MPRMSHILPFAPIAVMLPAPLAAAEEPAVPSATIRPGDQQLTCSALATELAALAPTEVPAPKKRRGLNLGKVGRVLMMANPVTAIAAPLIGGNPMSGMLVGQAAELAASGAAASEQPAGAEKDLSPAGQRRTWLHAIANAKGC